MLDISLELNRIPLHNSPYYIIGQKQNHHWWLTIFKMGLYTKPQDLLVNISIRFKDRYMLYNFLYGFEKTLPYVPYRLNNLAVHFTFFNSNRSYSLFKRIVRYIALSFCHLYCIFFNHLTRAFENTGDKLLYLYFLAHFLFIYSAYSSQFSQHQH